MIDDDKREFLAKRETIIKFDGGLPEKEARELAYTCYIHKLRPKLNLGIRYRRRSCNLNYPRWHKNPDCYTGFFMSAFCPKRTFWYF